MNLRIRWGARWRGFGSRGPCLPGCRYVGARACKWRAAVFGLWRTRVSGFPDYFGRRSGSTLVAGSPDGRSKNTSPNHQVGLCGIRFWRSGYRDTLGGGGAVAAAYVFQAPGLGCASLSGFETTLEGGWASSTPVSWCEAEEWLGGVAVEKLSTEAKKTQPRVLRLRIVSRNC